ncbi:MAG: hypothetical protein NUV67_04270 [archaeon]|nr:hypothetical protein [archaeon]
MVKIYSVFGCQKQFLKQKKEKAAGIKIAKKSKTNSPAILISKKS